jgi:Retrotransposon gag protein
MDAYLQELVNGVTMHRRNPNHLLAINPDKEQVWNDFNAAFQKQFVNITAKEDALIALLNLKMKNEDVLGYINSFNALLIKAQWGANDQGVIQ